jgi:hypothetical protein
MCRSLEEVVQFRPSSPEQTAKRTGGGRPTAVAQGRNGEQNTSAAHPAQDVRRSGLRRTHKSGLSSSVAGRSQDGVGQVFGRDDRCLDHQCTMRCGEAFDECGAVRDRRHPADAVAGVTVGTRAALGAEKTKRSLAPLRESSSSFICNRWSATWLVSSCARRATRYPGRRLPRCRRPDQPSGSCHDQARSNRSRFMTLFHAATKSCRNFCWASSHP